MPRMRRARADVFATPLRAMETSSRCPACPVGAASAAMGNPGCAVAGVVAVAAEAAPAADAPGGSAHLRQPVFEVVVVAHPCDPPVADPEERAAGKFVALAARG